MPDSATTDPIPDGFLAADMPQASDPSVLTDRARRVLAAAQAGEVTISPSGEATVDITDFVRERQALARAAGYREALAVMAAWHTAQETDRLVEADRPRRHPGPSDIAQRHLSAADAHALSARHAKALAAAADDPAGPLPLRVRYRFHPGGSHVTLRVFIGPEHGGASSGILIARAEELAALRAGWPGAAFIEESPHGPG